jgi:hypothetical protein
MGTKLLTNLLYSEHFSNTYQVGIMDSSFSGTGTVIKLATGLVIEYESQSDERYSPIKGSKATIPIIVEDSTLETYLTNTLLRGEEERFIVYILKNGSLFWVGYVLQDLCQVQDISYPTIYNIVATDGLARLKDLTFSSAESGATESVNEQIYKILQKTPLYNYLTTATDSLYSNSINWYEANMPAVSSTTDPLAQTFINTKCLCNTNEKTGLKAISYYEALEEILLTFNARILLSGGIFRIVSVNLYEKSNILYERVYQKNGTYKSTSSPSWSETIDQTTQWASSGQNQWQYYPAVREITRQVNIEKSKNLLDPTLDITSTSRTFPNVYGGSPRVLRFRGTFEIQTYATTLGATGVHGLVFEFYIKVGGYYLEKPVNSNVATWSTTSTDRYYYRVNVTTTTAKVDLSFLTPDLPSGLLTGCEIEITGVTSLLGLAFDVAQLDVLLDTNNDDILATFKGQNTASFINSKDYKLPDARFADSTDINANYRILTGANLAGASLSSAWSVDKTGATYQLNYLLILEIFAGQNIPNPRYQGMFTTQAQPHFKVRYNSEAYIINGVKYDLLGDFYDGEWFKIQVNSSAFTQIENGTATVDRNQSQYVAATTGDGQTSVGDGIIRFNGERQFAQLNGDLAAGTITSITVNNLTQNVKEGDKIILFPNIGTDTILLEASADASIGATSISIVSYSLAVDILDNSPIYFPIQSPVINYLRLDSNFPTSDPHIFGVAWWDTSNHNLKISNG